jgi:methyl-accepting chemotaxis protein
MNPPPDAIELLADTCERAAAGDLEARVVRTPDDPALARLSLAINHLLDIADAYARESAAAMDECAHGRFHRPILLRGLRGAYGDSARRINEAAFKMKTDAARIVRFQSERQAVARRVAKTTDSLGESASHLQSTSSAIGAHVNSTRRLAGEVAESTAAAARNVGAVAAACQELTACTGEINRRTRESNELTHSAVSEAARAGEAMQELGHAARKIGSVVDVIGKIARQTNLLALNATIEAARAGVHGRSFAVVADEVKNLSRDTARATEQIADQIAAIQTATGNVTTVITGVGDSIHRIDTVATAISAAVQEQALATEEIARRISDVSRATEGISAKMTEVDSASAGLEIITGQLNDDANRLAAESTDLRREAADLVD